MAKHPRSRVYGTSMYPHPMAPGGWVTLLACGGELLLLVLVLLRGKKTPMAGPLIGLCVVTFGWNFAGLAHEASGRMEWRWLDVTISPWTAPFALHFVLGFTGRRKQLRVVRTAAYVLFGLVSAMAPLALLIPELSWLHHSGTWAAVHLGGVFAAMALALALLVLHLRASHHPAERARTRVLIAALACASVLGVTELLRDLGLEVPRLGALGVLVGNALVVRVALRLRIFDRALSPVDVAYALVLATLGVSAYLVVFQQLRTHAALVVIAAVTLTLVLLAGLRLLALGLRSEREQLETMAQLGRLSAQLAHDLKNPLAALRGAAQFLEVEVAQDRPLGEHRQFLSLIIDQADRMQRVVNEYQRLGRLELAVASTDVNRLISETIALQPFAAGDRITVRTELAGDLPRCQADADLVRTSVENLLRNAFQAMPEGGTATVSTRAQLSGDDPFVMLAVADTGHGMDARTRERALEDFFSTRAEGTGLGLALVRRVAEAHGGRVTLNSREGEGTRVELWLPLAPPAATLE